MLSLARAEVKLVSI